MPERAEAEHDGDEGGIGTTIGDVINLLRDEFPELTVSKIRFLEGQGLIRPGRSPSGYRIFGEDDIRRLRYILREQRDHFLPLKVIKSKLTAWERGEEPATPPPEPAPPPESYFGPSGVSVDKDDLASSAGLDRSQVDDLVDAGILTPEPRDDGTVAFRDDQLTVARAAQRLLSHGLETRHLRTMRLAADREADLVSQLVVPLLRHRNPDSRRRAAETLAVCAQAGSQLKEAMIRARLGRLLEG